MRGTETGLAGESYSTVGEVGSRQRPMRSHSQSRNQKTTKISLARPNQTFSFNHDTDLPRHRPPQPSSIMHLMYTLDEAGKRIYTLKKITASGAITKSAHPARFSPDDKWSRSVPDFPQSDFDFEIPISLPLQHDETKRYPRWPLCGPFFGQHIYQLFLLNEAFSFLQFLCS